MALLRTALVLAAVAVLAGPAAGRVVVINNNKPKLDVNGSIVNAHDGTYRFHEGFWYYHGAEYGLCREPAKHGCDQTPDHCGFHNDHNVSVWRSPDLSSGSWEFRGHAVQCTDLPDCKILYRPHAVYNPTTRLWVLFVNYVATYGYAGYAVLTAPTPDGPFTLLNKQMNVTRLCPGPVASKPCGPAQGGAGDFDVLVDDDGTGYLVYGAQFYTSIERLTPDFAFSTGENASCGGAFGGTVFPDYFVEAPAMFKRGDVYYLLYGHCCCFCYQGSGVLVYTAPHPLGPWTQQPGGDLACRPAPPLAAPDGPPPAAPAAAAGALVGGTPTPGQGCLYNKSTDVSVTRAQQNFVISVPQPNGTLFLWTGDRWQQAPDGIKGHEGQYWFPLDFAADGTLRPLAWDDSFSFSSPTN